MTNEDKTERTVDTRSGTHIEGDASVEGRDVSRSLKLPSSIQQNIDRFTGRTLVLGPILDWFDKTGERLFLLTGGPGTGKSMIMAWLAGFGPLPANPEAQARLEQVQPDI